MPFTLLATMASPFPEPPSPELARFTVRSRVEIVSALRQLRGRFRLGAGAVPDDTWLAYVFYGHPALRLKRAGP